MNSNLTQTTTSQDPPYRPLAETISRPSLPRFDGPYRTHIPHIQRVSNLRINRALIREDSLEKGPLISPTIIHGERVFEPSDDLQRRLGQIREEEIRATSQKDFSYQFQGDPSERPERREETLTSARSSYKQQISKLEQREGELQKAVLDLAGKLSQTQNQLATEGEGLQTKKEFQQTASQQKVRIQELEEKDQLLQAKIEAAREDWRQKKTELQTAKENSEVLSADKIKDLERQINEQQEQLSSLGTKKNSLAHRIHKEEAELKRLQNIVSTLSSQNNEKEEFIRQQQRQVEELQRDKEKISRFANELVKKLANVENLQRIESIITVAKNPPQQKKFIPKIIKAVPKAQNFPSLTNKSNIISGIVYNADNQPISNALIVIKNNKEQPQRALRSNQLGEFIVTSSLPNGTYRIEIQKENINFDIIEIELAGKVLDPIEIRPAG
ncbi:carboxypeptidase regulatory-like domain-containing protein [Patescibacteria group bacterium]|nr:carboxypeptidase regulatory-like domain-containing protein [Patescibacteria group bacterium]